jgi:AraC family transcriptional regulator
MIISVPAGKIVGIQTSVFTIFNNEKYDAKAIATAWQEFFKLAQGTGLLAGNTFYGASIPSMSLDAPMDYFAGALVSSDFEAPAGFKSVELPAGDYFSFTHRGPITDIAASYQKVYMELLAASGREMRPAPHLEIYNSDLNPMDASFEMAICVPVL